MDDLFKMMMAASAVGERSYHGPEHTVESNTEICISVEHGPRSLYYGEKDRNDRQGVFMHLVSAPDWFLSTSRVYRFAWRGDVWKCKVNSSCKTFVDLDKHKVAIDTSRKPQPSFASDFELDDQALGELFEELNQQLPRWKEKVDAERQAALQKLQRQGGVESRKPEETVKELKAALCRVVDDFFQVE